MFITITIIIIINAFGSRAMIYGDGNMMSVVMMMVVVEWYIVLHGVFETHPLHG